MIFAVLFGLCVLGSHLFMQNALADIGQAASWSDYFADFKYGVPELILQLLTFSIIFTALEKRKQNKNNKAATAA
ncbi:MAG: hypothetical protein SCJ97_02610 [Bacillota bacterium]|nr:hypothetical protein [Bacillota bacterium]